MSFTTLFTALHYHFSLLIFFIMLFFFPPFKCGSHKKTAIKENLSIKKPPIFLFLPFLHNSSINNCCTYPGREAVAQEEHWSAVVTSLLLVPSTVVTSRRLCLLGPSCGVL